MNATSSDAGNHAPPHAIVLDGERYEFRHFGLPQLAEYERERYRQERDKLRELRDDYPAEEYVKRLDALRERYERHDFAFESEGAEDRRKPQLLLLVLRIMTGRPDGEAWRLFCKAPEEVGELMRLVIEESFPKAQAGRNGAARPAS